MNVLSKLAEEVKLMFYVSCKLDGYVRLEILLFMMLILDCINDPLQDDGLWLDRQLIWQTEIPLRIEASV